MRRAIEFIFLTIATQLFSACNNCSYWGRVINTQCRGVSGSLTKDKIKPDYVPPPPPPPGQTYIVTAITCPHTSAQLCSHYSNGAGVIGMVVSDAGGFATTTNAGNLNSCVDLWNAWGNGQLLGKDAVAVYFSYLDGQDGNWINCDDTSCTLNSAGGPLINFNDQGFTDRQPVSVPVGNYLACASIGSYSADQSGNSINVIPPLGTSFFVPAGSHDFTQTPTAYTVGSSTADQVTNLPMPVSGGTKEDFLKFSVTSTQNATLTFSAWGDAP